MNIGYIALHRKLIEWEWYTDVNVKTLFIHCLLKANFKTKTWQGITIEKGQFVTGVNKLSSEIGLTTQKVRTALKKLEKTNEIIVKSTNKNSLITVCNYDSYQGKEATNQQSNNNQITINQQSINNQITTTKKEKKVNKENNDKKTTAKPPSINFDEVLLFFNTTCKSLPKLQKITTSRKQAIKARASDFSFEAIGQVFEMTEESDFLTGKNERGWVANFDWILKPTNFSKIKEGNYKNKKQNGSTINNNTSGATQSEITEAIFKHIEHLPDR